MPVRVKEGAPRSTTQSGDAAGETSVMRSSKGSAFVVLGMHRSGTSAMARVLSLSGAALPAHMLPPQPDNPAGFWEPKELVDLNDQFLMSADSAWDDIFGYDARSTSGLVNDHNQTVALAALSRNYGDAPTIVLKDPRVSLLAPLWDRILKRAGYQPVYVIMVRHPLEVAESLRRRNSFAHGKSLMLWASYMVAAERDTRGLPRVFVDYDALVTRPLSILDRIEQQANVVLPRRTKLSANTIEQFVDTDLHHHRFGRDEFALRNDIWDVIAELYKWFDDASTLRDPPSSYESLDHAQRRMDEVFAAVGGVVAELRAQVAHVGALLANANHTSGVISSQAEQAQEAWNVERLALTTQVHDSRETAERTLNELRLAHSELHLTKDLLAEGEARFQTDRSHLEALVAERQAAFDAAEAERLRLYGLIDRFNTEMAEREASWRNELQERDVALSANLAELDIAREAHADLEKTVALMRMHAEAGQAEHERLEAYVFELQSKAQLAAQDMQDGLRDVEQTYANQLQDALVQWRFEKSALAELLHSREQALMELRSERDSLDEVLAISRRAYNNVEWQFKDAMAAASAEAQARSAVEHELSAARQRLDLILQSRSWFVTKPLRAAIRLAQPSR